MATKPRLLTPKPKRPQPAVAVADEALAVAPDTGVGDAGEALPALLPDTPTLIRELPEEVLAFLVRATPPRALWEWLSDDKRVLVLHQITRGFQRTLNVLRQPVVRNRLVRHLYDKPDDFTAVLRLWSAATPAPQVIAAVRGQDDDQQLIEQLPDLWHRYGAEALLLALLLDDRRTALDALDRIAEAEDEVEATGSPAAPADVSAPALADAPPALVPPTNWQERATAAEARLQVVQTELTAARTQLGDVQQQLRLSAQAHRRELHHVQQRLEASDSQLHDTKKLLDRTARRLKSVQREEEELATDSKRLKRQLRRQQQLNEELRKQLANVTARLQSLTPAPAAAPVEASPTTAAKPVVRPSLARQPQVSPLDQTFIWQSDGRPFRVTPREVKRAIDRNDEEFVFTLIQAFDTLRATNEPGYRMFLDRIREFDRYYSRVLTVDTTRVLIDASNVVRYETNRYGKGQLRHLLTMRDELRRRDCFPVLIYADASLPYHIDEPVEFQQMVKGGEVQMSNAGQEADELLAREARRTGAYVVTNDRSFHTKVAPDFEPPRITFRIHDGFLIVDDF